MRAIVTMTLLGLGACSSSAPVPTRAPPKQALATARARMTERGIQLDEAGARPDRLRTTFHCHAPYDSFDVTFAGSDPAPRPFEISGTIEQREKEKARCPYMMRAEITTVEGALQVDTEWWRLAEGKCESTGNALLGKAICQYDWKGAAPPDDARTFVQGLLRGL
ncbi:MAG: hypothetical protein ACI9U2_002796 [Bradymonadia bacterium]|jgi:hypothetical protein